MSEPNNTCPKCKRHNKEGAKICIFCGEPLISPTVGNTRIKTRSLDNNDSDEIRSNWGSAKTPTRLRLIVVEDGVEHELVLETKSIEKAIIGREDPVTKTAPPVDLTQFNALDKGVSRQHAAIERKDTTLHIVDLAAGNGTFLNGQRLVPEQSRILRDGDDVRLGNLVIRVAFDYE